MPVMIMQQQEKLVRRDDGSELHMHEKMKKTTTEAHSKQKKACSRSDRLLEARCAVHDTRRIKGASEIFH